MSRTSVGAMMRINGADLHVLDEGSGPETIVFAHGLLWSSWMYDAQVAALKGRYRCVRWDFRGQGQSEVTADGYDMDTLFADAAELIETLKCGPVHFVGLSMGGFVGMRLAARRPALIRSLILLETSADAEPATNVPKYRRLNLVARWLGLRPVAGKVMPIMFGQTFLNDPARAGLRAECRRRLISNDKLGITRATTGVIERTAIYGELSVIRTPTLVMVGDEDTATVPEKAERIRDAIAGAKLVRIPRAGHTSTVEEPAFITAEIERFLSAHKR